MQPTAATTAKPATAATNSGDTSIKIFRRHLVCERQGDSLVVLDASGVNGVACFNQWAQTRQGLSEPEKTFQRCLTAHVTGSDGRRPFEPAEEAAILAVVRQKKQWPAFAGTQSSIGVKGFRGVGYHERQAGAREAPTTTSRPLAAKRTSSSSESSSRKRNRTPTIDGPPAQLPPPSSSSSSSQQPPPIRFAPPNLPMPVLYATATGGAPSFSLQSGGLLPGFFPMPNLASLLPSAFAATFDSAAAAGLLPPPLPAASSSSSSPSPALSLISHGMARGPSPVLRVAGDFASETGSSSSAISSIPSSRTTSPLYLPTVSGAEGD